MFLLLFFLSTPQKGPFSLQAASSGFQQTHPWKTRALPAPPHRVWACVGKNNISKGDASASYHSLFASDLLCWPLQDQTCSKVWKNTLAIRTAISHEPENCGKLSSPHELAALEPISQASLFFSFSEEWHGLLHAWLYNGLPRSTKRSKLTIAGVSTKPPCTFERKRASQLQREV